MTVWNWVGVDLNFGFNSSIYLSNALVSLQMHRVQYKRDCHNGQSSASCAPAYYWRNSSRGWVTTQPRHIMVQNIKMNQTITESNASITLIASEKRLFISLNDNVELMPWATLFLSLFNTKKAFHHWKIPHSVLPQSNLYVRQSLFYSFNGCSKFYNYIRIYIESLRWIYYTNIILHHLYSLLKFLYSVHERFKL